MPVVQAGVVDEGELLASTSVSAKVTAALDAQFGPVRKREGHHFGVGMDADGALLALPELF